MRGACWAHPPAAQGLSQQIPLGNLPLPLELLIVQALGCTTEGGTVESELWGKGGLRKGGGTLDVGCCSCFLL